MLFHTTFGECTRSPVRIRVGLVEQTIQVSAPNKKFSLEFVTEGNDDTIEVILPKLQSPKQLGLGSDQRLLGLGISWLQITPLAVEDGPAQR